MPASISPTTLGWRNLVNRYPSNCARPTSNKRISRIEVKSEFDIRGAVPHRVGCGKQAGVWQAEANKRWPKDSDLFGLKKTWRSKTVNFPGLKTHYKVDLASRRTKD